MEFDYWKLRGKIKNTFGTQQALADAMGYSRQTISNKLSGRVPWTQADIVNAAEILGILDDEITDYFLKRKQKGTE